MLQVHHLQPTLLVYKTMQNLSTVILKFLFCVTVHRAIDAAPFAYEPVKQTLRISPKRSTIARGGFEPSTLRV